MLSPAYKVRVRSSAIASANIKYYVPDVVSTHPGSIRREPQVRQLVEALKNQQAIELESNGDIVIIPAVLVGAHSWRLQVEAL